MISTKLFVLSAAIFLARCEYPYIFGNSINTKGVANGLGLSGITGAQTTVYALDDVSQSVAYSNGTGVSSSNTQGAGAWSDKLGGANTSSNAANSGEGNALADSVSKSFTRPRSTTRRTMMTTSRS